MFSGDELLGGNSTSYAHSKCDLVSEAVQYAARRNTPVANWAVELLPTICGAVLKHHDYSLSPNEAERGIMRQKPSSVRNEHSDALELVVDALASRQLLVPLPSAWLQHQGGEVPLRAVDVGNYEAAFVCDVKSLVHDRNLSFAAAERPTRIHAIPSPQMWGYAKNSGPTSWKESIETPPDGRREPVRTSRKESKRRRSLMLATQNPGGENCLARWTVVRSSSRGEFRFRFF